MWQSDFCLDMPSGPIIVDFFLILLATIYSQNLYMISFCIHRTIAVYILFQMIHH